MKENFTAATAGHEGLIRAKQYKKEKNEVDSVNRTGTDGWSGTSR